MDTASQRVRQIDESEHNKKGKKTAVISNPAERKRVKAAIYIAILLVIVSAVLVPKIILQYMPLHTDDFISFHQYVGSVSRIGFFFAVAIYPIFLLLKYKKINKWRYNAKKILGFLAKIVRQWHVPVAVLSMGVVLVHAYLAILNGFRFDGGYISGTLALVVLGVLAISGVFRYKKMDKKWHLILGLLFVTLFIIHTMFSPTVG